MQTKSWAEDQYVTMFAKYLAECLYTNQNVIINQGST